MENNFESRKPIWHSLGVNVSSARTVEEALDMAELNWQVYQRRVFTDNGLEVVGHRANIRDRDNKVLGIVSDKYTIVQNHDAFSFANDLLDSGVRFERAGEIQGGKGVWLLLKIPERYQMGGSWIDPYIVLFNTHDGSSSMKIAVTPIRVLCSNTLNLAVNKASRTWSSKHSIGIKDRMDEARDTLLRVDKYMDHLNETINELSDINWAREMMKILESKAFNEIKQESQIDVHKDRMYIPSRDFEKLFLKHYYPERMNINEICKELFALGILYVTEAKGYTCKYQGAHHYAINILKMKLLCGK